MSRRGRRHAVAVMRVRRISDADRLYLKAYGKMILCERRRPAEESELRRRRFADGSYPVPAQMDDFKGRPLAAPLDPRQV